MPDPALLLNPSTLQIDADPEPDELERLMVTGIAPVVIPERELAEATLRQIMGRTDGSYGDVWVNDRAKKVLISVGDWEGDLVQSARAAAQREFPGYVIDSDAEVGAPDGDGWRTLYSHGELAEAVFDEAKHPRWPHGTPRGGEFMRVGERFTKDGHTWEIAHVANGHIIANEASGDINKVETRVFKPDQIGGHIPGAAPAPIPVLKKGEGASYTGASGIPIVDAEAKTDHDPSIHLPAGSPLTPDEWKRFGQVDQHLYVELASRYGTWKQGQAKSMLTKAMGKYTAAAQSAVRSAFENQYSSGYGSSAGDFLSLQEVFDSGPSEQAKAIYREARELQGEIKEVNAWELMNRLRSPDVSVIHWGEGGSHNTKLISGAAALKPGYSTSWSSSITQFGSTATAFAVASRHVLLASDISKPPGASSYMGEAEFSNGDRLKLNPQMAGSFTSGGLAADLSKWFNDHFNKSSGTMRPGSLIKAMFAHMKGEGALPLPPPPPGLAYENEGQKPLYHVPPPEVIKQAAALAKDAGYSHGQTAEEALKPIESLGLEPGDIIEGHNVGKRYLVIADPGHATGLAYMKLDGSNTVFHFGSMQSERRKLEATIKLPPPPEEEGLPPFHPDQWTQAGALQTLGKMGEGEKVAISGDYFEVTGQSGHQTMLKSLTSGLAAKANAGYPTAALGPKPGVTPEGYEPPEPEKPKWQVAGALQKGDTFAFEGQRMVVTNTLKNGTVRARAAVPGAKVQDFSPSHPALEGAYRPGDWTPGGKAKVGQLPEGALISGSPAKVRPYLVLGHEGKVTHVQNLDTGEKSTLSGNKSYPLLVSKEDAAKLADTTVQPAPKPTGDLAVKAMGAADDFMEGAGITDFDQKLKIANAAIHNFEHGDYPAGWSPPTKWAQAYTDALDGEGYGETISNDIFGAVKAALKEPEPTPATPAGTLGLKDAKQIIQDAASGLPYTADGPNGTVTITKHEGFVFSHPEHGMYEVPAEKQIAAIKTLRALVNGDPGWQGVVSQYKLGATAAPEPPTGPKLVHPSEVKVGSKVKITAPEKKGASYEVTSVSVDDKTLQLKHPNGQVYDWKWKHGKPITVLAEPKAEDAPLPEPQDEPAPSPVLTPTPAGSIENAEDHGFVPFKSNAGPANAYKHDKVGELAAGEHFFDKTGKLWKVKNQSGAHAVITDGQSNYSVNGKLRVKRAMHAKGGYTPLVDSAPPVGGPDDKVSKATAPLLDPNPAGYSLQDLNVQPGDHFTIGPATWSVTHGTPVPGFVKAINVDTGQDGAFLASQVPDKYGLGVKPKVYGEEPTVTREPAGKWASLNVGDTFTHDDMGGKMFKVTGDLGDKWEITHLTSGNKSQVLKTATAPITVTGHHPPAAPAPTVTGPEPSAPTVGDLKVGDKFVIPPGYKGEGETHKVVDATPAMKYPADESEPYKVVKTVNVDTAAEGFTSTSLVPEKVTPAGPGDEPPAHVWQAATHAAAGKLHAAGKGWSDAYGLAMKAQGFQPDIDFHDPIHTAEVNGPASEAEKPELPIKPYGSKWASGGKAQYHHIADLKVGDEFRDKNGWHFKVTHSLGHEADVTIADGPAGEVTIPHSFTDANGKKKPTRVKKIEAADPAAAAPSGLPTKMGDLNVGDSYSFAGLHATHYVEAKEGGKVKVAGEWFPEDTMFKEPVVSYKPASAAAQIVSGPGNEPTPITKSKGEALFPGEYKGETVGDLGVGDVFKQSNSGTVWKVLSTSPLKIESVQSGMVAVPSDTVAWEADKPILITKKAAPAAEPSLPEGFEALPTPIHPAHLGLSKGDQFVDNEDDTHTVVGFEDGNPETTWVKPSGFESKSSMAWSPEGSPGIAAVSVKKAPVTQPVTPEAATAAEVIPDYSHVTLTGGKAAGGSQGAQIMTGPVSQNAAGGVTDKWLLKTYGGDENRVATELLANAIYRRLGVRVANAGTTTVNGKVALTYPLEDGQTSKFSTKFVPGGDEAKMKAMGEDYMADALLANHDFVGLEDDNTLWNGDEPTRLDQGGTFFYRAMGESKPFDITPTDVWSMLAKGQGKRGVLVSENSMRQQAAQIADTLTPEAIDQLVDAAPFPSSATRASLKNSLKGRVQWMREFGEGKHAVPGDVKAKLLPEPAAPVGPQHDMNGEELHPDDGTTGLSSEGEATGPEMPIAPYGSKWASGGAFQYPHIAELGVGDQFRDKEGSLYQVASQWPQGTSQFGYTKATAVGWSHGLGPPPLVIPHTFTDSKGKSKLTRVKKVEP